MSYRSSPSHIFRGISFLLHTYLHDFKAKVVQDGISPLGSLEADKARQAETSQTEVWAAPMREMWHN
jgi:hypothetical protein